LIEGKRNAPIKEKDKKEKLFIESAKIICTTLSTGAT